MLFRSHLIPPTAPAQGSVVSNELCMKGRSASFVRHVCIDVGGTPMAGQFRAGQSFGVVPPGTDAHGKPQKVRLYSIASTRHGDNLAGNTVSLCVRQLQYEKDGETIIMFRKKLKANGFTDHDIVNGKAA